MTSEIPSGVQALIGTVQYKQDTEFEISIGYVHNNCAAVQNGNPLYWDEQVAEKITRGQIAPPTMLSTWFRPPYWTPDSEDKRTPEGERMALQCHFDLKELFGLTEAVVANNKTTYGEPVRIGDKLTTWQIIRSISDVKKTKLGRGRFWVIDVISINQHGENVGTDTYTIFGYKR